MKKYVILGVTLSSLLATACSSSSDSTTPSTNAVGSSFSAVTSAVAKLDEIMPNNSGAAAVSLPNKLRIMTGVSSPNNIWDGTGWISDPRCSGGADDPHCSTGAVTLKFYMGFLLDESSRRDNGSDISVFGRIKSALQMGCAMSSVLSTDGSLPAAGSYSMTFDTATNNTLKTYCNFTDDGLANMTGQTVSVTVTDTTDTTYYDRKFVLTMGSDVFTAFMRVNSTEVNISTGENGSNYSRAIVSLNRTTGVVSAEYVSRSSSGASGGGEWHRVYYDPAANDGALVGSTFDFSGTPNRMMFTFRGTPGVAGSQVAYSVGIRGFGLTSADSGANTNALNHYKACINMDDGTVATNDTLSCSGSVTGVDTSGAFATVFDNLMTALATDGSQLVGSSVYNESAGVPFTSAATLFTAAVPAGN